MLPEGDKRQELDIKWQRMKKLLMSLYPLLAKLKSKLGKNTKAVVTVSFNVFKTKRSEAPCWQV